MKEMGVTEFERALRAGLGRCVLCLDRTEDVEPYREAVLSACLNDYAYDNQSEGTRAWYTYKLLSYFNDDDFFFSRVEKKLREVICWQGNNWEFEHLFDLVLQFARHGHRGARQLIQEIDIALIDCLAEKTPEPKEVDYELQWLEHAYIERVHAGGIDEFITIASNLGRLFKHTDKYNAGDFDQFVFLAREWLGKNIVSSLRAVLDTDGCLDCFIQSVEQYVVPVVLPDNTEKDKRAEKRAEQNDCRCDMDKIVRDIALYDNTDSEGDWHGTAMDIAYDEETVFPMQAYMYVYTGLCACCRNRAVIAMHKHGLLTDELLRECEFDSYDETREWAKGIIKN